MQVLKPPNVKTETDRENLTVYSVRKNITPFTWRIKDKTTVVVFKNISHAITIASSLEKHFFHNKRWPDMTAESLELPHTNPKLPSILNIYEEDWNSLREYCTLWGVSCLTVEDITNKTSAIVFSGQLSSFEANDDMYKSFYEEIYLDGTQA
jgi:hypothetical protein